MYQARNATEAVTWPALGTSAVLVCAGDAAAAREAADREIRAMDAAASRFDPTSELSRLNRAGGQRMSISPTLLEALQLAIRAAALTDGAVDPTLGDRLVALGYDRDTRTLEPVAPDAPLRTPEDATGTRAPTWQAIELWTDPPAARLGARTQLDLGATAKALAADRAPARPRAPRVAGSCWPSAATSPSAARPPPTAGRFGSPTNHRDITGAGQHVTVREGGLATSSLLVRRWRRGDQSFHHVLDPRTEAPVRPVWRTASVAAATCADANIGHRRRRSCLATTPAGG